MPLFRRCALLLAGSLVVLGLPAAAYGDDGVPAGLDAALVRDVADGGAQVVVGFGSPDVAPAPNGRRLTRAATTRALRSRLAATKRLAYAAAGSGVAVQQAFAYLPVEIVVVDDVAALRRLATAPEVTSVSAVPADPPTPAPAATAGATTSARSVRVADGDGGRGVRVAVVDTGVALHAPGDPFGDCSDGAGSADCRVDYAPSITWNDGDWDNARHGTNVAAIVAEAAPEAHLDVYSSYFQSECGCAVFGGELTALNSVVASAAERNVRAVTLLPADLRTPTRPCGGETPTYAGVVDSLRAVGVVPVLAAGSARGGGNLSFSQCLPGVLSVGASGGTDDADATCADQAGGALELAACAEPTGDGVDLLASGVDVTAGGVTFTGSPQAAARVAGVVADLASTDPDAGVQDLVNALVGSGTPVADRRVSPARVIPRLDVDAARAALAGRNSAVVTDAGCATQQVPNGDDTSLDAVSLPFPVTLFGRTSSTASVSTDGHVTLGGPAGAFSVDALSATGPPVLAPFLADADTRGGGRVTYGEAALDGHRAFCVTWDRVGYYAVRGDRRNTVQLLVVDRSDRAEGDVDVVFDYGSVTWESGEASGGVAGRGGTTAAVGLSAGDGDPDHATTLPGSGRPGALLDDDTTTGLVNGSRGSAQPGRYVWSVRDGVFHTTADGPDPSTPSGTATVSGVVSGPSGTASKGSPVQACPVAGGSCTVRTSRPDGRYLITGLDPGAYRVQANPPEGSTDAPGWVDVDLAARSKTEQPVELRAPQPLPAGTTITHHGEVAGVPTLFWDDTLELGTTGCPGGTGSYTVSQYGRVERSGQLEGGATLTATLAPLEPLHGTVEIDLRVGCGDGTARSEHFFAAVDPTGRVVDTLGRPRAGIPLWLVAGTAVRSSPTFLTAASADLLPSSRVPLVTDASGRYHLDVVPGFYGVLVTSTAACHWLPDGPATTVGDYPKAEVTAAALAYAPLTVACEERLDGVLQIDGEIAGRPSTLNAYFHAQDWSRLPGTVAFSGPDGPIPGCEAVPAGDGLTTCTTTFTKAGALSLTATYSGDADHPRTTAGLDTEIYLPYVAITWQPADLQYPGAVGPAQLNATADVDASFTYRLDNGDELRPGTVLGVGEHQVFVEAEPADGQHHRGTGTVRTVTVRPGSQQIVLGQPGPVRLTLGAVSLLVRGGGSGRPVVVRSTTPAVCSVPPARQPARAHPPVRVRLLRTGTCTLTATQAGNERWSAAPSVRMSFRVVG